MPTAAVMGPHPAAKAASVQEYATAASGVAAWRAPSGGRSASVRDVRGP